MFPVIKGLSFPPSRLRKPSVPNDNLPNDRYFVPQAGQVLLITDTPASSAQFLIHALLQSQLKREGEASRSCVLVSVDHDFAHISGIAARANLNLSQCLRDKNLMYIDALSQIPRPPAHLAPGILVCPPLTTSLRPLYDVIHRAFQDLPRTAAERVLILGDISTLEWIGVSSTEVTRFVRAIRALAAKNESGVVISYHSHSADLPIESDVLRDLVTTSDVHVEVRELSSGLSSAVSGEVAIHSGFAALDPHFVPIPRERAVQYRLTDGGVVWFERGTSAGVL